MLATLSFLALASCCSAHFHLNYPEWRADSLSLDNASQWIWPCANISQTPSTPRTPWPLTGGSILLNNSHSSALTYINLGLGDEVTTFNTSFIAALNQTASGSLCLPSVGGAELAELGVREGTNASLQVVTVNDQGNSLYNCADITFSGSVEALGSDRCVNSTGVDAVPVENTEGGGALNAEPPNSGGLPVLSGAQSFVMALSVAFLASLVNV
ncbi:MAG: hypothetical protein M1820_005156 [Bogoriella megaspora]|nr:MAG: hypothetical protein M1820_005156 [Bogoriella megaspora]